VLHFKENLLVHRSVTVDLFRVRESPERVLFAMQPRLIGFEVVKKAGHDHISRIPDEMQPAIRCLETSEIKLAMVPEKNVRVLWERTLPSLVEVQPEVPTDIPENVGHPNGSGLVVGADKDLVGKLAAKAGEFVPSLRSNDPAA
jgi:hypothetical protein